MSDLLLGCGTNRERKVYLDRAEWRDLVTLDIVPTHKPDIVHDLLSLPWPLSANQFEEVHAYDVMEHLGQQGDFRTFFTQWAEIWRVLRPGGKFFGISPALHSRWLWGDPGHTRAMTAECLYFLSQPHYAEVGRTPMTDYRFCYSADFDIIAADTRGEQFIYVLEAIKPARTAT